jgi:uncharacterized protein (DUF427 family)
VRNRDEIEREQEYWRGVRRVRPAHIEQPGPGQESVWDYTRPPRVERATRAARVEFAGVVVAESSAALRVLETSSPPVYYFASDDVRLDALVASDVTTLCEWKGVARYASLRVDSRLSQNAAWSYPDPGAPHAALRDHWAFHARRVDACWVGDDRVAPQPGTYYGGWITPDIVGPFKGIPGSDNW